MPTDEWLNGLFYGLVLGILAPALMMRWWAADSHRRSMAALDRAMKLLDFIKGDLESRPSQKEEG